MTRNESFLRGVIEHPDDDAPRLAYADWFEKEGAKERAEVIRVQCALAKSPPDDPRLATLREREQRLLAEFGWAWAEEFGNKIQSWQFHRGFIERIENGFDTSAEHIESLLNLAPIRYFRDTSQLDDLSGVVAALPKLRGLAGLEFDALYAFDNEHVAKILASPYLANLRTLVLHHDRNGNLADDDMLVEAMASPNRANLEELAVNVDSAWRGPSRKVLRAIAASPHLRKLRKLNLTHAAEEGNPLRPRMDVETIVALGKSPNLANLEELDLRGTSFSLETWDEVLKWPCLARLKLLRLYDARQVRPPDNLSVALIAELPKYRRALERTTTKVDWTTELQLPYFDTVSWKGISWKDLRRQHLFAMWPLIEKKDYGGLEAAYRADCRKYAGEEAAQAIEALPFKEYENKLEDGLKKAIARGRDRGVTSIFFRFSGGDAWYSEYHVSGQTIEEKFEPHDEHAYAGPMVKIDGPQFLAAAALSEKYELRSVLDPDSADHFLLARTIAAFGRCVAKHKSPVPIFFSNHRAVFLIQDAA